MVARSRGLSRVFEVKYTDLRVSSCGYESVIIRVWHELDGKDVCDMAGRERGCKGERGDGVLRLIRVYEEVRVIGARCK